MAKRLVVSDTFAQLKAQLKRKDLGRLYFFYGEETFLLNHYLAQMRTVLLDPLTEAFNYHRFNNENFSLQAFADSVENIPMMAEHSFVQVEDIDLFKMNEADRNQMAQLLADLADYCTVVFTYLTVPFKPDRRQKKLWETVDSGLCVEFQKQDSHDLIAWVSRHFMVHGKKISAQLCAYLIEISGGTMTALAGEIEKISAYSGADEICRADIDAVTEPVLDAVVFQITDLLSAGRYDQALQKLRQLLQMQQEPLAILGAIGSQFRRLGAARTLLDQGRPATQLQKLCGLADYPARKTMDAARRFSAAYCRAAGVWIMETDYQMKTSYDDSERLLELLILRLAQEARHG